MASIAKNHTALRRSPASAERPVIYRGIEIAPIAGKRSPVAQAIREALQAKAGFSHRKPAHG